MGVRPGDLATPSRYVLLVFESPPSGDGVPRSLDALTPNLDLVVVVCVGRTHALVLTQRGSVGWVNAEGLRGL